MAIITSKVDLDKIALGVGEVTANPTANTILDRLKTIGTNTTGASNFTPLNSTNVDNILNQGYILQNQIGEVQTNPTADTVLERLKYIGTGIDTNNTIGTGLKASNYFTRSADTSAYSINDICTRITATNLNTLDFGASNANKYFEINNMTIVSEGQAMASCVVHFFDIDTLDATMTDNDRLEPSYVFVRDHLMASINSTSTDEYNLRYSLAKTEKNLSKIIKLDITGKVFYAIQFLAVYTPLNSQKFRVSINGKTL
jgi:hypothetical protein